MADPIHVISGTNVVMNAGGITPEMLGIIHGRAAKALGLPNAQVCTSHWAGRPHAVGIWVGHPDFGGTHVHTFTPDLSKEDPCVLEPVDQWSP